MESKLDISFKLGQMSGRAQALKETAEKIQELSLWITMQANTLKEVSDEFVQSCKE